MRVDEERLLSRVATLESQLSQAGKHWTEEALKEEFNKLHVSYSDYIFNWWESLVFHLQSEKIAYQEAAKEALQKLHNEKLEAVVLAAEQERARASAEVEAQMVKDLLNQAQHDVEVSTIPDCFLKNFIFPWKNTDSIFPKRQIFLFWYDYDDMPHFRVPFSSKESSGMSFNLLET